MASALSVSSASLPSAPLSASAAKRVIRRARSSSDRVKWRCYPFSFESGPTGAGFSRRGCVFSLRPTLGSTSGRTLMAMAVWSRIAAAAAAPALAPAPAARRWSGARPVQENGVDSKLRQSSGSAAFTARKLFFSRIDEDAGEDNRQGTAELMACGCASAFRATLQVLLGVVLAASVTCGGYSPPPLAQAAESGTEGRGAGDGSTLFHQSCVACHVGGGNVVQPGATLFLRDLTRNEVADEDSIYEISYYGRRKMPGYGAECQPRGQCTFGPRLSEEQLRTLAKFVMQQAVDGWPTPTP